MPSGVYPRRSMPDRLWSNVDRRGADECWPWLGNRRPAGYGSIRHDGKNITTNAAAIIASGGVVGPGQVACHTCDNPPCCNPAHLYVGTSSSNQRDAVARGRHSMAKLTDDDVTQICELVAAGNSYRSVGRRFGVRHGVVSSIVRGVSYTHVKRNQTPGEGR